MFADPLDTVKPAHFSSANRDLFNFLCVFSSRVGHLHFDICSFLSLPSGVLCCERRVGGCFHVFCALDGHVTDVAAIARRWGVRMCFKKES